MSSGFAASSRMSARIPAFDWATTPIGPIKTWPESLRHIVDFMLASPELATVAVGPSRILIYNDVAAAQYGAHHPHALGRPLADTFDDYPTVAQFYDRAFAGESVHVPAQPLDPSGEHRDEVYEAFLTPIRDEAGMVVAVHMSGIARGAQARAEAALRQSEARYRALFETMDEGFVVNELVRDHAGEPVDLRYLELNPAVERLVGWKAEETVGRLMSEMITPAETKRWVDDFATVIASGTSSQTEHHHESLGMWFQANITPIGGDRVALVYQNITDQKRSEAFLRESEERQAFLLHVSDALRSLADPADIQGATTRLLRELLHAGWC